MKIIYPKNYSKLKSSYSPLLHLLMKKLRNQKEIRNQREEKKI